MPLKTQAKEARYIPQHVMDLVTFTGLHSIWIYQFISPVQETSHLRIYLPIDSGINQKGCCTRKAVLTLGPWDTPNSTVLAMPIRGDKYQGHISRALEWSSAPFLFERLGSD